MRRISAALLGAGAALALAACDTGPDPNATPTGGAAGAMGPEYCETVPTDPNEMEQWNQLCMPGDR